MKKLKLNLDEIKVESFETNTQSLTQGTIHALGAETEGPVDTCYDFCITQAQTCDYTCWATCTGTVYVSCPHNTCDVTCSPCEF